jgi:flagellar export protein FliJ
MKFKFRYDSVLAVKELLVSEKQKELSEINIRIENAKQLLSDLKQEILSVSYSMENNKIKSEELVQYKSYQNFLLEKIKNQRGIIKSVESEREIKLKELISLNKEHKIIESLKKKHFDSFNERRRKLEEKLMNEFAVQKFVRSEK